MSYNRDGFDICLLFGIFGKFKDFVTCEIIKLVIVVVLLLIIAIAVHMNKKSNEHFRASPFN